jgi:hypothetical protein
MYVFLCQKQHRMAALVQYIFNKNFYIKNAM